MISKARNYKPTTVRRLDTLSGNICAAPGCSRTLIAKDKQTIASKICHIEAASEGGPRFNPGMTDDERRHYDNLILLCDECHLIIDNKENENEYPVSLIQDWKKNHEGKQITGLLAKTSLLMAAIDAIARSNFDNEYTIQNQEDPRVFGIQEKLEHNNVVRNRYLFEDYKVFYTKIAVLYDELEDQGSFKKEALLNNIRKLYLLAKGQFSNSDDIIESIEDKLLASCEAQAPFANEYVSFGVSVVMVDAFMRCKILEPPP